MHASHSVFSKPLFCIAPSVMSVIIEQSYTVSFDAGIKWKVKNESLKCIHGTTFVKLVPHDYSFMRFIVDGAFKVTPNMSLRNTPGYMELVQLRNSCADQLQSDSHASASAEQHVQLFAEEESRASRKSKFSVAQLQEIRNTPTQIEFTLPGMDGSPPLDVGSIKAAHPCDDVWIRFDPDTIGHVVRYLRQRVCPDSMSQRREYKSSCSDLPTGVWKNGAGRKVQRVSESPAHAEKRAVLSEDPSQSILPWGLPAHKKWKVFKHDDERTAGDDARQAEAGA